MDRNSRNDGLNYNAIWINGKPIRRSLLRKTWTRIALDCYNRQCNCNGCKIVPPLDSTDQCQVKYYVMGYIQMGYYPKENENEKEEYSEE